MHIRELTIEEFEHFIESHPLGNHYQTINYALLMGENGFDYEFIGFVDENNKVYAASLILLKNLNWLYKYGYAPKGFIIDYSNKELLKKFTANLLLYYRRKKIVFIKINPEIAIAQIHNQTSNKTYNQNIEIKNNLIDLGYKKLKDNLYFESMVPRYNGIVNLRKFNIKSLNKNTRNKIKRGIEKGLKIELADRSGIDILYNFIKRKRNKDSMYYKDYYNIFFKANNADLFLVSIDTNEYLINAKNAYEKELNKNAELANILMNKKTDKNLNIKMESDKNLLSYKNNIMYARSLASKHDKIYIAGALVIKYKNRINIVISGYDTKYKKFNANYFLHYEILKYYQKYYDFADLNGMTGDFTNENPYKGLNDFKLGFKPNVYEFIGEYDFIIKEKLYKYMLNSGKLAKKFNKADIKKK